jgi:hypothetical protein
MRTQAQIEASRRNGAKSRGPVTAEGKRKSAANSAFSTGPRTPEGKASSSRNAEKHHALANSVALPNECKEEFLQKLQSFHASLQPVGFLEEQIVETIAVADWHRRRYWIVGMAKVAHATKLQEKTPDLLAHELNREIPAVHTALAVSDNVRTLEFFRRCDTSYGREYRRARLELKELQAERKQKEAEDQFFENIEAGLTTDDFISPNEFEKFIKQTEPNQPAPPVESTTDTITNIDTPTVIDIPGEPRPEGSGISQPQPTVPAPAVTDSAAPAISSPVLFPKNSSNQTDPKPGAPHNPNHKREDPTTPPTRLI